MILNESTQMTNWLFSREDLLQHRKKSYDCAVERLFKENPTSSEILTFDECMYLLRNEENRIVMLCNQYKYPTKVLAAALTFFKRFYVHKSIYDDDPRGISIACIFVASKSEEGPHRGERTSDDWAKIGGYTSEQFREIELNLLAGIQYNLLIHHPFRALRGYLEDWSSMPNVGREIVEKASIEANDWVTKSLGTDECLIVHPGVIALTALWISSEDFKKNYLPRWKKKSGQNLKNLMMAAKADFKAYNKLVIPVETVTALYRKYDGEQSKLMMSEAKRRRVEEEENKMTDE